MRSLQKAGGFAALFEAVAYVVGMALFLTVLAPYVATDSTAAEKVSFLVDNQGVMYAGNLVIYIAFGIALVVLALALHARLKDRAEALMQVATAFALIWAGLVIASGMVVNVGVLGTVVELVETDLVQAESVWLAVSSVQDSLGGGNEIVGGIWVLLVSLAALKGGLPRFLNYLGLAVAAAGIVTVVPGLEDVGAAFGLLQIVWFVWLGIVLIRVPAE